jgi:hypothetical protein
VNNSAIEVATATPLPLLVPSLYARNVHIANNTTRTTAALHNNIINVEPVLTHIGRENLISAFFHLP